MAGEALLLFGKVPRPGAVKTRLSPLLDAVAASRLYAAFLQDVIARTRPPGVRVELWLAPPTAGFDPASLVPGAPIRVREQLGAGLAERMAHAFETTFAAGADRVVLRNTDSPLLPEQREAEAFAALASGDEIVLGPDHGGGYYLVGLSRPRPDLFLDLPMSVPSNLDRTLLRARSLTRRVRLLAREFDVDTAEDLRLLRSALGDASLAALAPATADAMFDLEPRLRAFDARAASE